MGRQACGGENTTERTVTDRTERSRVFTPTALADVVPLARPQRKTSMLARAWIHLRQEAASGEPSPRSPTPPRPTDPRLAHPSRAPRQTRTGDSRSYTIRRPDDAA
jgi:hypothetical protein